MVVIKKLGAIRIRGRWTCRLHFSALFWPIFQVTQHGRRLSVSRESASANFASMHAMPNIEDAMRRPNADVFAVC
jgi:hypothetical protein